MICCSKVNITCNPSNLQFKQVLLPEKSQNTDNTKPGSTHVRQLMEVRENKTFSLSLLGGKTFPPPILALTNAGVCADSTHIPGETDGGSQDTGRTGRNCSNSTNLQRSSSESRGWGGGQVPERDPTARMLLSCINKQQQLLRCLCLPPPPPPQPLYVPLEDHMPGKV